MKVATIFLVGAIVLGAAACGDDDSEGSATPTGYGPPITYVPTEELPAACATLLQGVIDAGPAVTPPLYFVAPEGSEGPADCPVPTLTPEQP